MNGQCENEWTEVEVSLPLNGVEVETKIDDAQGIRNEAKLVRNGRLWFAGDMYVYYEPTHWRHCT